MESAGRTSVQRRKRGLVRAGIRGISIRFSAFATGQLERRITPDRHSEALPSPGYAASITFSCQVSPNPLCQLFKAKRLIFVKPDVTPCTTRSG
jgi:hypothetical protein